MDAVAITFESFITPAGMVTAGLIINRLVEITKKLSPTIDAKISGAWLAFAFSAVLYVLTAISMGGAGLSLEQGLQIFMAWIGVAGTAMGVDAGLTYAQTTMAARRSTNDALDQDA